MKYRVRAALMFIFSVVSVQGYDNPVENQSTQTVNGSLWDVGVTDIHVGLNTAGNMLVVRNSGIIAHDSSIIVGDALSASNNTMRIADPGSKCGLTYDLVVGLQGMGNSLIITNGGMLLSDGATIGTFSGGNSALVSGSGSVWSNSASAIRVGAVGSGNSLAVQGGGLLATGEMYLGEGPGSDANRAEVQGAGSTLNVYDGGLFVGHVGKNNTLEILDGGRGVSLFGVIGEYASSSNNTVTVAGAGSVWHNTGTLQVGAVDNAGNTLAVTNGGTVSATGVTVNSNNSVHVQAGGSLLLNGDFNASQGGTFDLSGGTLAVTGQLSGLSVLSAGSRLETPDVLGDLTVLGTFAPGKSPADSLLNGELNLASNAVLEMEIGGLILGTEYDRLTVTGEAKLDGTLSVLLLNGFAPSYGDTFDLFNWDGGTSNTFAGMALPTLSGGLDWDASNLYSDGSLSVIPEPATMSLLGLSSLGLFWMRRVRHRRSRIARILLPVRRECNMEVPRPHFHAAAYRQILQAGFSNHEPLALLVICIRKLSIASLSGKNARQFFQTLEDRFWDRMLICHRLWRKSKSAARTALKKKALNCLDAFIARIMK
ncbi:MAG: PEP-CTERM sorting domain-containing protein [Kiritimatiellales bacterium]|nr:PEP-CTERM sorting domain-containing protein [Kiritimatiellales bacterium]